MSMRTVGSHTQGKLLSNCKAPEKSPLENFFVLASQGDAEDLPFPTDSFDRYVSAGSIEYWPEPQRGIKEAYR